MCPSRWLMDVVIIAEINVTQNLSTRMVLISLSFNRALILLLDNSTTEDNIVTVKGCGLARCNGC